MKPIAWYDPSNGMVSTDQDCSLFTPLGQVWALYPKEEHTTAFKEILIGGYVLRFWPSDNGWMCGITESMMDALEQHTDKLKEKK